MTAVLKMDEAAVQDICRQFDLDIANFNCPGQLIISGLRERVKAASDVLASQGHTVIPLNVAGAYHSRVMKPAAERFRLFLQAFTPAAPAIPLTQNVTGGFTENAADINANLAAQIAGSVRWESCVRAIRETYQADAFIEFGPGTVLSGLVRKTLPDLTTKSISCLDDIEKF